MEPVQFGVVMGFPGRPSCHCPNSQVFLCLSIPLFHCLFTTLWKCCAVMNLEEQMARSTFAVYIRQLSSESFPYILTFTSRHSQKMIMSVFWHWGPGVTIQGVCEFLLCLWSACNVVLDNTTQQYPALFSCVCILFTQQDYVMPCMD